jgi:hypothetical protein
MGSRLRPVALDADAGNLAIALTKRQVTAEQAVARLALDAPCRPDLVDHVAAAVELGRAPRLADWPPAHTTVMLLRRAGQVALGRVKLVGPDGVSVEQVTLTGKRAGPPVRYLRLRHYGHRVGDYRTVEELARHVDLATLVEELPPPENGR